MALDRDSREPLEVDVLPRDPQPHRLRARRQLQVPVVDENELARVVQAAHLEHHEALVVREHVVLGVAHAREVRCGGEDDPRLEAEAPRTPAAAATAEYDPELIALVPDPILESFAGTGNPFRLGDIVVGEHVVDVGSGAGTDSLIAASMVGPEGQVIGVEMTQAMLEKARGGAASLGFDQVEFRQGHAETLPIPDGWADVVISNGVVNLSPSKERVLAEMFRVLRPGGRLQIADVTVAREVPEGAKRNIDLWAVESREL